MRLFIALDLDHEDYFKQIQERIPKDVKASFPKQFHLTLKFLGETDKKDLILDKLKNISFKPFVLKTTNIGFFPSDDYIKVVWLGLEGNDELLKLQKQVEAQLKDFNFRKDHDFHPHITLARIKFLSPDQKRDFVKLKDLEIESKEFQVEEFKLIKSELLPDGPVYEDVEVFKA